MSVKKTAYFSRIYGHDDTWREIGNRTENHGVPGSNPGPATSKSPANNRKTKAPDPIARAFGRSHPLCNGPRLQRALRCHQEPKPLSLLECCYLEEHNLEEHK